MAQPEPGDEALTPEAIAALLSALSPLTTSREEAIKSRVMERIAQHRGDASDPGITVVRAGAGVWEPLAPGAEMKVLLDDGRFRTWLARLSPGTRLPGHDHPGIEECLMLEGSVYIGDVLMNPGDYQIARTGTRHTGVYSPGGCVLLVRSESTAAT